MPKKRSRKGSTSRYISSLDGLRALCALGVIGYHLRLSWCSGGLLGVTVLFVLSGYLVTCGLLREFSKSRGSIDLLSFWRRRVARLMPTAIVFVAVCGAVCALADHALFTKMRPDIVPALLMVINWTKILSNESYFAAAGNPSPLTHFWSLAIEWQFYLIWPPILYFLMRKRVPRKSVRIGVLVAAAVSAILMAILYVPGADPSRSYYGTDTRAMSLLLGCWLAIVWPMGRMGARHARRMRGPGALLPLVVGPLCVVGLIAMMLFTEGYSSFSYYGGFVLCSLLSVGAIAGLVPEGSIFARVLSLKPLEWIGKRSFAIYVWHYPILELMNPLNATEGIPWWKILLELAIIFAISDLSYRFIEVPLRALGSKPSKERPSVFSKSPRDLAITFAPACALVVLGFAVTAYGLVTVEPVTISGDKPEERRVMQASLKKPVQDGVYDVVLIGDSVSLGANEQLNDAFPHGLIDTAGERQMSDALPILKDYIDQGIVGDQIVVSIGTNGVLSKSDMDELLRVAGNRQIWYVNLRSPNAKDIDNNDLIDSYVSSHENMHLVDWNKATAGHEDWLIEDGIHLTWDGRDAFAKLIVDTMGYEEPDESNTVYSVTILGDTVCLGAADNLADAFPMGVVDTADGRSPEDVAKAYTGYASQNVVGDDVVIAIGNEGQLGANDLKNIIDAIGSSKKIWLVSVHGGSWQDPNNEMIQNAASSANNIEVVDWYAASESHDDWFEEDGIHLTKAGAEAYADLLKQKVKVSDSSSKSNDDEDEEGSASSSEKSNSESDEESDGGSSSSSSSSKDRSEDSDSSSSGSSSSKRSSSGSDESEEDSDSSSSGSSSSKRSSSSSDESEDETSTSSKSSKKSESSEGDGSDGSFTTTKIGGRSSKSSSSSSSDSY